MAKIRAYFGGNIVCDFVYKLVSRLVKKDVDYPCPFYVFVFVLFLGFKTQANFRCNLTYESSQCQVRL